MKIKTADDVRVAVQRLLRDKKLRFSTSMKDEYRWCGPGTDTVIRVSLPGMKYSQVLDVWEDVCMEIHPQLRKHLARKIFILMGNRKVG